MSEELTPPDYAQCQAERREGSFMTLGPRRTVRCTAAPTWLAEEKEPGPDGLKGSMTLCDACCNVLRQRADMIDRVTLTPLR